MGLKVKSKVRRYEPGDVIEKPEGAGGNGSGMDFIAMGNAAAGLAGQAMATRQNEGIEVISDGKAMATGALKGAGYGATIGSAVPVVGTAVGAAVGGMVGATAGVIGNQTASQRANEEIKRRYGMRVDNANLQSAGAYGQAYQNANIPMGRNGLKVKKAGCGCGGHQKFDNGGTVGTAVAQKKYYNSAGQEIQRGKTTNYGGFLPNGGAAAPVGGANTLNYKTGSPGTDNVSFEAKLGQLRSYEKATANLSQGQHEQAASQILPGYQGGYDIYQNTHQKMANSQAQAQELEAQKRQRQQTEMSGPGLGSTRNLAIRPVNANGIVVQRSGGLIPVRRKGGTVPGK